MQGPVGGPSRPGSAPLSGRSRGGAPRAGCEPESLQAPALRDAHRLHQAAGLDLAEAGQRLEHREHLHLADGLVAVGHGEELRQVDRAQLQLLLDLGPLAADLGGLGQCGLALFGRECRRLRHGGNDSASAAAGHPDSARAVGPVRRASAVRRTWPILVAMTAIDLNADLAEHDVLTDADLALLDHGDQRQPGLRVPRRRPRRDAGRRAAACVGTGGGDRRPRLLPRPRRVRPPRPRRRPRSGWPPTSSSSGRRWPPRRPPRAVARSPTSSPTAPSTTPWRPTPPVAAAVVDALAGRCAVLVAPPGERRGGRPRPAGVRRRGRGVLRPRLRRRRTAGRPRPRAGAVVDDPTPPAGPGAVVRRRRGRDRRRRHLGGASGSRRSASTATAPGPRPRPGPCGRPGRRRGRRSAPSPPPGPAVTPGARSRRTGRGPLRRPRPAGPATGDVADAPTGSAARAGGRRRPAADGPPRPVEEVVVGFGSRPGRCPGRDPTAVDLDAAGSLAGRPAPRRGRRRARRRRRGPGPPHGSPWSSTGPTSRRWPPHSGGTADRTSWRSWWRAELEVAFVGFAPGFPYLTGLPPAGRPPPAGHPARRSRPARWPWPGVRRGLPACHPGGWHLLGRTDVAVRPGPSPPLPGRPRGPRPLRGGRRRGRRCRPGRPGPPLEAGRGTGYPRGARSRVSPPPVQDVGGTGSPASACPAPEPPTARGSPWPTCSSGNGPGAAAVECTAVGPDGAGRR